MRKQLTLKKFTEPNGFAVQLYGTTERDEEIIARLSQRFIVDATKVLLVIGGVSFKAPDNLKFTTAYNWVIREIESLGYDVATLEPGKLQEYYVNK
jgi:hypothetical protein